MQETEVPRDERPEEEITDRERPEAAGTEPAAAGTEPAAAETEPAETEPAAGQETTDPADPLQIEPAEIGQGGYGELRTPGAETAESGAAEAEAAETGTPEESCQEIRQAGSGSSEQEKTEGCSPETEEQESGGKEPEELKTGTSEIPDKKEKNKMKKFFAVVAAAILFGALAGGTMLGVNVLGKKLNSTQTAAAETIQETQATAETQAQVQAAAEEEPQTAEAQTVAARNYTSEITTGNSIEKAQPMSGTVMAIDVSEIVEASMPEVVAITNTTVIKQRGYNSFYDYFYGNGTEQEYTQTAAGSGVIIRETADELLIVTNNHVVEGADELAVTFIDGETVEADIKGTDSSIDIAVIAIPVSSIEEDTRKAIKVAVMHEEDDLKCGEGVIAIGNALGYGQSVTVGVISALDRVVGDSSTGSTYEGLIQTDAAINPGNSGGALLNNSGELIGINVAKFADTEVEGMGFSIPIYKAVEVIDSLSNAKTKIEIPEESRGRLGIYMNTISSSQSTALNIPAGVIIVGFSDEQMEGYSEEDVQESPAREAGLLKNDIIVKFDGQTVTDAEELSNLVQYYEAGTDVVVTVQRLNNGEYEEKEYTVTLGKRNVTESDDDGDDDDKDGEGDAEEQNGYDGRNGQQGQNPFGGRQGQNGQNDQEAEDGQNSGNGEDGNDYGWGNGDMYEFFKKYLEQYQ